MNFNGMYFSTIYLSRVLPTFLLRQIKKSPKPLHIIFCMVDHFEPGTQGVGRNVEKERMRTLLFKFPKLADMHMDSFGNKPKRTWFFPPHYHRNNNLKELVSLCEAGYGEIELHLHHGKKRPDTSDNLKKTIEQCIKEYSLFGIFGTEKKKKKYAFIHGNSALNNARDGRFCGVNDEIRILKETGCFADFTFPCFNEANPSQVNSIFYAIENIAKPKSYSRGIPVERYKKNEKGLMMIQGPLHPYLKGNKIWGLRLYGPAIDGQPPVDKKRIDAWVKTAIHIKGNSNWIIVKTHTHGAVEDDAVLGEEMSFIHSYLEQKCVNNKESFLHYVTARELFNIIKAVEAGELLTNPEHYRDYRVNSPQYNSDPRIPEASEDLKQFINKTYDI